MENCNNKEPTARMCLNCEDKCQEGFKVWWNDYVDEHDKIPPIAETDIATGEVRYPEWGWHGGEEK